MQLRSIFLFLAVITFSAACGQNDAAQEPTLPEGPALLMFYTDG